MRRSFLNLPGEIRTAIYKELLVSHSPVTLHRVSRDTIKVWSGSPTEADKPEVAILRTNSIVFKEAIAILYGANCFSLRNNVYACRHQLKVLSLFLDTVSAKNASYICHICIPFPFLDLDLYRFGKMALTKSSELLLGFVKDRFPALETLETSVESGDSMESIDLRVVGSIDVTAQVLELFDRHLRTIASLKQIVVNLYEDPPDYNGRDLMLGHGWILKKRPRPAYAESGINYDVYLDYQERVDSGDRN